MKLYGGMDLHSTNVATQLINEEDRIDSPSPLIYNQPVYKEFEYL
jgi:hypothetical protein